MCLTDTPWSMHHVLLHSLHSAELRHIYETADHWKHILRKICNRSNFVSHGRTFDNSNICEGWILIRWKYLTSWSVIPSSISLSVM
ncbi:hypothetical protein V5799_030849 [Amblyomma americanum]|uniref:Uncharacterized protein n=1 Tax=Amblyomma americanum TaxID=6943 RepID=A0AAQ4EM10_AMBAM